MAHKCTITTTATTCFGQFLPTQRYACPSVCPSVTSRYSNKTAKPRITKTMLYDSPGTLVFLCWKYRRNSSRITPTGVPNTGGV